MALSREWHRRVKLLKNVMGWIKLIISLKFESWELRNY